MKIKSQTSHYPSDAHQTFALLSYMFYVESVHRNYLIPSVQLLVIPLLHSFIARCLVFLNTNYIIHSAGKGHYMQDLLLSFRFSLPLLAALTEHVIHVVLQIAVSLHIKRQIDEMKRCNLAEVRY